MGAPTGRFGRADRLLDSRDFQRISREGRRVAGAEFVLLIRHSQGQRRRLGISASRHVGNAVTRNRIKRAVRQWFRERRSTWPEDMDLLVIARRKAAALQGGNLLGTALDKTLERASKQRRKDQ